MSDIVDRLYAINRGARWNFPSDPHDAQWMRELHDEARHEIKTLRRRVRTLESRVEQLRKSAHLSSG